MTTDDDLLITGKCSIVTGSAPDDAFPNKWTFFLETFAPA